MCGCFFQAKQVNPMFFELNESSFAIYLQTKVKIQTRSCEVKFYVGIFCNKKITRSVSVPRLIARLSLADQSFVKKGHKSGLELICQG